MLFESRACCYGAVFAAWEFFSLSLCDLSIDHDELLLVRSSARPRITKETCSANGNENKPSGNAENCIYLLHAHGKAILYTLPTA